MYLLDPYGIQPHIVLYYCNLTDISCYENILDNAYIFGFVVGAFSDEMMNHFYKKVYYDNRYIFNTFDYSESFCSERSFQVFYLYLAWTIIRSKYNWYIIYFTKL